MEMTKYPKFYFDIEQRSQEWFDLRALRVTASMAQAIGNAGKGLETCIIEMLSAYYSNTKTENYTNDNMQCGVELENQAATVYAFENDYDVRTVGFIAHNDYVGCSPDLLVSDNGLAEIKCPNDKTYFRLLMDDKIDSKYMWQMQMQMICCRRSWCDYVCYNPNFEKSLIVHRIFPDKETVKSLFNGFAIAEALIKQYKNKYKTKGNRNENRN